MNKREAARVAHRIAYRFLQQALDGGGFEAIEDYGGTSADQKKIDDALDAIAQRHFELGDVDGETSRRRAARRVWD